MDRRDDAPPAASGDAQHYQNIVLSGVDADGADVTNEVTYLVLDVVEELHISDFPRWRAPRRTVAARLLRRVAEVQRLGGGIVSVYSERAWSSADLWSSAFPLREARGFANDGCWEVLIPGKTAFSYRPFDMLVPLQQALGLDPREGPVPAYRTFDELYQAFLSRLAQTLKDTEPGDRRPVQGRSASDPDLAPHRGLCRRRGGAISILKELSERRWLLL